MRVVPRRYNSFIKYLVNLSYRSLFREASAGLAPVSSRSRKKVSRDIS